MLSFGLVFDGTARFYSPGPAAVIGVHRPAAAEPCQPHTKYSLVVSSYPADTPTPPLTLSDDSGQPAFDSPLPGRSIQKEPPGGTRGSGPVGPMHTEVERLHFRLGNETKTLHSVVEAIPLGVPIPLARKSAISSDPVPDSLRGCW